MFLYFVAYFVGKELYLLLLTRGSGIFLMIHYGDQRIYSLDKVVCPYKDHILRPAPVFFTDASAPLGFCRELLYS